MLGFGAEKADVTANGAAPALDQVTPDGTESEVIGTLLIRRSLLGDGAYRTVSDSVLAANSRAAESQLRAATLRAEARATNWLPTLGPQVSLTSLGSIVTSLVVEQVLFDNGRKKAERDYAKADVEVAAVALSQDTNDRVLDALELYLTAQTAKARAAVNQQSMKEMQHFAWVMDERVKGGVSSRVEAQLIQQKLNQLQADMASDLEAAVAAMAELNAMAATPLDDVTGTTPVSLELVAKPLVVLKAEAEAARAVAEAKAARAGLLPGLTAIGNVGSNGSDAGLTISSEQGLGLGTGAAIAAAKEAEVAAAAQVGQVNENADRSLRALEGQLASLQRQQAQAQTLADGAAANYKIFAQQQREGQRTVPEVVGLFETRVRTAREAAALPYDAAKIALKIAALRGVLVDGDQI